MKFLCRYCCGSTLSPHYFKGATTFTITALYVKCFSECHNLVHYASVESLCCVCCYDESKYAECHYVENPNTECHYAGCHYAKCHYAKCHYAGCHKVEYYCAEFHCDECYHDECHQAECRGAILTACAVQPICLQDIF
jgi:hypothetical protein